MEFNSRLSGLTPHRFSTGADSGRELRAVFYLDRRGRICLPEDNPYLPVVFHTGRQRASGKNAHWQQSAAVLADEMKRRGTRNQVNLSPGIEDVRPWCWRGFVVGVRYTYFIDFPFDQTMTDKALRATLRKATERGLKVERVTDPAPVVECLQETEVRQGFGHGVGLPELKQAQSLMGDDALRLYVGFNSDGKPISATVALHSPDSWAISWIGGTKKEGLGDGADPLVTRYMIDDLRDSGAVGLDMCGANIESVAHYKSRWGGRLVTNYSVRTHSLRSGARFLTSWLEAR